MKGEYEMQDMNGKPGPNDLQSEYERQVRNGRIGSFVWGLVVGAVSALFLLPLLGEFGANYFWLPAVAYLVISLVFNKWQYRFFNVNFMSVLGTFTGTVGTLIVMQWV